MVQVQVILTPREWDYSDRPQPGNSRSSLTGIRCDWRACAGS